VIFLGCHVIFSRLSTRSLVPERFFISYALNPILIPVESFTSESKMTCRERPPERHRSRFWKKSTRGVPGCQKVQILEKCTFSRFLKNGRFAGAQQELEPVVSRCSSGNGSVGSYPWKIEKLRLCPGSEKEPYTPPCLAPSKPCGPTRGRWNWVTLPVPVMRTPLLLSGVPGSTGRPGVDLGGPHPFTNVVLLYIAIQTFKI